MPCHMIIVALICCRCCPVLYELPAVVLMMWYRWRANVVKLSKELLGVVICFSVVILTIELFAKFGWIWLFPDGRRKSLLLQLLTGNCWKEAETTFTQQFIIIHFASYPISDISEMCHISNISVMTNNYICAIIHCFAANQHIYV